MAGQLAIFSKFHFVKESKEYQERITKVLMSKQQTGMVIEDVKEMRQMYEEYLEMLMQKNLISKDDQYTYSELYPLFDPYYVCYDDSVENYENLSNISSRIFSSLNHLEKQNSEIEKVFFFIFPFFFLFFLFFYFFIYFLFF